MSEPGLNPKPCLLGLAMTLDSRGIPQYYLANP